MCSLTNFIYCIKKKWKSRLNQVCPQNICYTLAWSSDRQTASIYSLSHPIFPHHRTQCSMVLADSHPGTGQTQNCLASVQLLHNMPSALICDCADIMQHSVKHDCQIRFQYWWGMYFPLVLSHSRDHSSLHSLVCEPWFGITYALTLSRIWKHCMNWALETLC